MTCNFILMTPGSGAAAVDIGKPNAGGGIENWGIVMGGPGGSPGGEINGVDGKIGGTKVEAMFEAAGG